MTKLLFDSNYVSLNAQDIVSAFRGDPRLVTVSADEIMNNPITKLAAKYGLVLSNCECPWCKLAEVNHFDPVSKAAAKNLVASRGLYINNQPIHDSQYRAKTADLLDGKLLILRAGKDKMLVLAASPEDSWMHRMSESLLFAFASECRMESGGIWECLH